MQNRKKASLTGLSMLDKEIRIGLTYDDVVLVPAKSQVLPSEVDTTTFFSRNIPINIPIVSSAMDTVTEARLAIAIAREGGIGVVHRVLAPAGSGGGGGQGQEIRERNDFGSRDDFAGPNDP